MSQSENDDPPEELPNSAVESVAQSVQSNVESITSRRVLAMFMLVGFIYLGTELGQIAIPFAIGLLAFFYLAIASLHMWTRQEPSVYDRVIVGHVILTFLVAGSELGVVDLPGVDEWANFIILTLIVSDGYIITE